MVKESDNMEIINNNTVVVTNSEELKDVLSNTNDYNYVII